MICRVGEINRTDSCAQAIQMMVDRLVARFDPDQIILFGSQARGTAEPGSDVDLLVIMPVSGSKRDRRVEMRVALHDIAARRISCWPHQKMFCTTRMWWDQNCDLLGLCQSTHR